MRGEEQAAACFSVMNCLAVQPVTSKRVAHAVVPIVALPRRLIFMGRSLRRIGSKRQVIGCYSDLPAAAGAQM
jgi:hypothetical protein